MGSNGGVRIPRYDRQLATELLAEKPDALLPADQVAAKAHRHWDRKQHLEAATLFSVAAERSLAEGRQPDQSPNHATRAAITLALAGRVDEATPILYDATAFDWVAAGLPHDTNMIEWAFTRLLLISADAEPERFAGLFEQAVARCAEVEIAFPRIHPQQEALLAAAVGLSEWGAVARIADLMGSRRPLSRPARAQLSEARLALARALGG